MTTFNTNKAKKSLGQHFLKSKPVVKVMISSAAVVAGDIVLEIGPGKGVLTEGLLEAGANVIAIEKDGDMIVFLEKRFEKELSERRLVLLKEDILDFNPENIKGKYKIAANIPYYITGAIIRKFLETQHQPTSMTLLVQKEVGQRIVARDGKESLLSISVKVYGKPKVIQKVKAELFSPAPKVDSAIFHVGEISKDFFKEMTEQDFFKVLKAGFAHKRKFAASNLQKEIGDTDWKEKFTSIGLLLNARAEDIGLEMWRKLTN